MLICDDEAVLDTYCWNDMIKLIEVIYLDFSEMLAELFLLEITGKS